MEGQPIRSAVISTDGQFRSVLSQNGDGPPAVEVAFEILVPFIEISHGHLEELRYVDPEVVFLDLEEDPVLGCKLAQFLAESAPNRRLVATGSKASPEFLMQVMQAGISEYLPKPVTHDALIGAINRVRRKLSTPTDSAQPARREPGKLFAFFSAKGGSGTTTVATNLAIQVHRLTGKRTVLVDLDLELGEIALFLGVEPRFNFVDLARNFHRMDAGLLASFIEAHESGVHLLSAPYHPEKAETVTGDHARQILLFLKNHYDYVVVANVDLPSLRNIQRCQHLLDRVGEKSQQLRLVINRLQPENDITLEDVERSLNMEVYWTLPNDYDSVIYSINTGRPVILDERCPYAHDLEALGAKILGLPSQQQKKRGWLSRAADKFKNLVGSEAAEDPLMLPPAVVGGERA